MKYVFFDIECANCFKDSNGVSRGKICEFGYVITDENFNVINSEEIIINPKDKFDFFVLNKMLAYRKEIYLNAEDYATVYDKIKNIFELEDAIYIGHTIDADAEYLNDEALRYNKPYFHFKFYDISYVYRDIAGDSRKKKLEEISRLLNVGMHLHAHRAQDDAYTTMLIVKDLCKRQNLDIHTFITNWERFSGVTENGVITTIWGEKSRNPEAINFVKKKG